MKRLISLSLIICLFVGGCKANTPLLHGTDMISYIELIHNSATGSVVVNTISESDIIHFMNNLEQLNCRKNLQPVEDLGEFLVCFYYVNGDADFVGTNANAFLENGEYTVSGWYYYERDALVALFDQYANCD